MESNLFDIKIRALLHDPPDKMWVLLNNGTGIYSKGHEEEAKEFWKKLGLEKNFGEFSIPDRVREADRLSSAIDRWSYLYTGGIQPSFEYNYLHNIFDPSKRVELQKSLDKNQVESYVKKLNEILSHTSSKQNAYNTFYFFYEALWIDMGLPVGLADTRAPTHQIFDHLYATDMLTNWIDDHGNISGYYVVFDMPSIQKIVNSARKAGDAWAGSWLISYLSWKTFEELIWDYGPDILIAPSARMNPFYLYTLWTKVGNLQQDIKDFLKLESCDIDKINNPIKLYGLTCFSSEVISKKTICAKDEDINPKKLLLYPLIPGTISLALPKDDLFSSEVKVKEKIEENFKKGWKQLKEEVLNTTNNYVKALEKIGLDRRIFDDPLIYPRVYVLDVGETYKKLEECLSDVNKCEEFKVPFSEQINFEKLSQINKKYKNISGAFLYQFILYRMKRKMYEENKKRIVLPFNVWYFDNGSIKSKVKMDKSWTYCSLCNDEPAIVKFAKTFKNGKLTYEDPQVEKIMEGKEKDFKPGEALGPRCLFKRLIYIASRTGNSSEIPYMSFSSVEDIAQSEYIKNIYFNFRDYISNIKVNSATLKDYIEREDKDILEVLGVLNASDAQKKIQKSIEDNLSPDKLSSIGTRLSDISPCGIKKEILKKYIIESLTPRFYLVAVKSDGDNVGKLINGKIPTPDSYIKLYEKLASEQKDSRLKSSLIDSAKFLEDIIDALNGSLLVTPTYHSTLSRALMFTALYDAKTTVKYGGLVIYVGGDDLLVLLPIEASIKAIKEYRENYGTREKTPFLKILNANVSAPIAYGKSFGVAIFNMVTHELYQALQRAQDVMEDVAKEVEGKNSVAYTELSTPINPKSVIPLSYNKLLDRLEDMLNLNLMGILSTNWGRDFDEIEGKLDEESWIKMYQFIIKENTVKNKINDVKNCLGDVSKLLEIEENKYYNFIDDISTTQRLNQIEKVLKFLANTYITLSKYWIK